MSNSLRFLVLLATSAMWAITAFAACTITATGPTGTFDQGEVTAVTWNDSGICSAQITATVYRTIAGDDTDPVVSPIEAPGDNDGVINGFGLDAALFPPDDYHVCIGEFGVPSPAGDCGPAFTVATPCSIAVTGPNGSFDQNATTSVTWNDSGACSNQITATIYRTVAGDDTDPVISPIESPGTNDGYIGGVGLDAALFPAGDYHVCVGEFGVPGAAGDCGSPFTVLESCSINVTGPSGNFTQNDITSVTWNDTGNCANEITATIYRTASGDDTDPVISPIESPGTNDGFIGDVGLDAALFPPDDYHVCIGEFGVPGAAGDCGAPFTVLEKCNIAVTAPTGVFEQDDVASINWIASGNCSGQITATLYETVAGDDTDPVISPVEAPGANDGIINGIVLDAALFPPNLYHPCVGEFGVPSPAGDCGASFTVVAPQVAISGGIWISETVGDGTVFEPNVGFIQGFTLENPGPSDWNSNVRIVRMSGSIATVNEVAVVGTIAPGSTYTFDVFSVAPANDGNHNETWALEIDNVLEPIRAANGAWSSDIFWTEISVQTPELPNDLHIAIDGGNPTPSEIYEEIHRVAEAHDIPPAILQAAAWLETGWTQYWKTGGTQWYSNCGIGFDHDSGDIVEGYDFDEYCIVKSVGKGIMQITFPTAGAVVDGQEIPYHDPAGALAAGRSWRDNIEMAAVKLDVKWEENIGGMSGCDTDRRILENWFYPLAWYNGSGIDAFDYVVNGIDIIRGVMAVDPSVQPYIDTVPDMGSPTAINGFTDVITGNPTAPNEVYTLHDLYLANEKIHRWTGDDVYEDITNEVAAASCVPGAPPAVGIPRTPGAPNASVNGSQVYLSWTAVAAATHYPIEQSTVPGVWVDVDDVSDANWIGNYTLGTEVSLRVAACNAAGCSAPSDAASVVVEALAVPPVVTGVTALAQGIAVTTDWDDVAADFYRFEVTDGQGFSDHTIVDGTDNRYVAPFFPSDPTEFAVRISGCNEEALPPGIQGPPLTRCGPWSVSVPVLDGGGVPDPVDCEQIYSDEPLRSERIDMGQTRNWCINLPADVETLTVVMHGPGLCSDPYDADIGLQLDAPMDAADFDAQRDELTRIVPWMDGSCEPIVIKNPPAGLWFLGMHGSSDMAAVPGQSMAVDVRVHWHKVGETLENGFRLEENGASRVYAPIDLDYNDWLSIEYDCASRPDTPWGGCGPEDNVDPNVLPITHSCFTSCQSNFHTYGDLGHLDWNRPNNAEFQTAARPMVEGVVIRKGWNGGYGNNVIVLSVIDGNFAAREAHCDSLPDDFVVGDYVDPTEITCWVGGTGGNMPIHLHGGLYQSLADNLASGGTMNTTALRNLMDSGAKPGSAQAAWVPLDQDDYIDYDDWKSERPVWWAEARCPVDVMIVDDLGNVAGPGGFGLMRNEIPGVTYRIMDGLGEDFAIITAEASVGPLSVMALGTDVGQANLVVSSQLTGLAGTWLDRGVDRDTVLRLDGDLLVSEMGHTDDDGSWHTAASFESAITETAPNITGISHDIAQLGDELVITGTGFGTHQPGGELELVRGGTMFRPLAITSWTATEIHATVDGLNLPIGDYALQLVVYPERAVSNATPIGIGDPTVGPSLLGIDRIYAIADQPAGFVRAIGTGIAMDTELWIGGAHASIADRDLAGLDAELPTMGVGLHNVLLRDGLGRESTELVFLDYLDGALDHDGDGLTNETEVARGTDPAAADTDGDGVSDGQDAFAFDPTEVVDTDGDGVGDNADLTPWGNLPQLLLTAPAQTFGPTAQLVASGAPANAQVGFAGSQIGLGDGPCLPSLGGLCVPLANPVLLGVVAADASGNAVLEVPVPPVLVGQTIWLWSAVVDDASSYGSLPISMDIVAAPPPLEDTGDTGISDTGDTGSDTGDTGNADPADTGVAASCEGRPNLLDGALLQRQWLDFYVEPYVLGTEIIDPQQYDQVIWRPGQLPTDALRYCVHFRVDGASSPWIAHQIIDVQNPADARWNVEGAVAPGEYEVCFEIDSVITAFPIPQLGLRNWSTVDSYTVLDAQLCVP